MIMTVNTLGELAPTVALRDFIELTKPRITLMVVLTGAAGFLLASREAVRFMPFVQALVGIGILAAGAAALNQLLEREADARMKRTAQRPLPSGRLEPEQALVFGVTLSLGGLVYLTLATNALTAVLGAATLLAYLFVYTPMKRLSPNATLVGAVPGAMPPVMGWTAFQGELPLLAWLLFGILFLWQLPHFLSIAWLYRADYARAGYPMLPVLDAEGRRTARQMVVACAALMPVSVLPVAVGLTGWAYLLGVLPLGMAFLACCLAFSTTRTMQSARRLMLASVVYLPGLLAFILLDRIV